LCDSRGDAGSDRRRVRGHGSGDGDRYLVNSVLPVGLVGYGDTAGLVHGVGDGRLVRGARPPRRGGAVSVRENETG